MPFGIDIVSDSMVCSGSGGHNEFDWVDYGILGIIPRTNEPFIWDNPRALRTSNIGPNVSLTDIWSGLMLDEKGEAKYEWELDDGNSYMRPSGELIADAIKGNIPNAALEKTVIAIDNYLSEFQQDTLLKSLRLNGFTKAELLWRPIAICLHLLDKAGRETFTEDDKIAIVDFDSYYPELTFLSLKYMADELVPVRSLPPDVNPLGKSYNAYKLKRDFINKITNNSETQKQLKSGPFSGEIFAFLDSEEYDDIFIRRDLSYNKLNLEENWKNEIGQHSVDGVNFEIMRKMITDTEEYQLADYKCWNGYLARIQNPNIFSDDKNEILFFDKMSVSNGAADYAQRIVDGRPTYYDTLPGLEIFSQIEGGGYEFFTLIDKGEVPGGQKVNIPKPLKKFKLDDTDIFSSVLRSKITEDAKILKTKIPSHTYSYDVPLIINAEMFPANGHALVTIEGDADHADVFGSQRRIQLDWKTMEDFEIPDNYSGPEVYPVQGRIADDIECRDIVKDIINNRVGMSYIMTYKGHPISYTQLHGPWGYNWPWGEYLGEPQRAMFGARIENDDEIKDLAHGISEMIYNRVHKISDRHKYLNYMFRYTPNKFLEELRDIYSSDNPDLNVNTIYGVGRTFYKKDDFELFVDFFIKISETNGYPCHHNQNKTVAYIWAFFRPLCYYENTNQIPSEKAGQVLRIISYYARLKRRTGNVVKYILCSILFCLRFRTNGRIFLRDGSELRLDLEDVIKNKLPQIPYPPAMFDTQKNDKLNDFVYRFLCEEQTNDDIEAIKGLVTSMA